MGIVRKNQMLSIAELWFDEPDETGDVDVLYYKHCFQPITEIYCEDFYTIFIDLTKEQDVLWNNICRNVRREIRLATEKYQLVYEFWHDISCDVLNDFFDFYDQFALQKGLSPIKRSRLVSFRDAGVLDIARVNTQDGNTLVWQVCYRGKNQSVMLHSASMFRNASNSCQRQMVGRANRYLYWQNIVRFKKLGLVIFDLGGWYAGSEDEEKLRINEFKKVFGGEIVKVFNCSDGITIKGKLYLALRRILRNSN